jgi:hypothetical protein
VCTLIPEKLIAIVEEIDAKGKPSANRRRTHRR